MMQQWALGLAGAPGGGGGVTMGSVVHNGHMKTCVMVRTKG